MPFLTRRQVLTGMAKALGGAALALVRHWFGMPAAQAQVPPPTRIFLPLLEHVGWQPPEQLRYFFRVKVISIIFSSRPPLAVTNIS